MRLRAVLAANVRRKRRALELTQEDLAHRAGIDRTYVSAIERQVHAATVDVVDELAEALGVSTLELLTPLSDV